TTRSWCASCRRHTNLAQRSGVAPASKSGRDSGRRRVAGSASQHSRRLCTANGVAVLLTATRCLFSSKPRTCVLILFQVTALHPLLTFTALAGAFKMSSTMISKAGAQIRIYKDPEELALKAARGFARLADQYVVGSGRFTVALAGGSTPKAMLSLLAQTPFRETVPWSSIHFFWGDERCVPPDHQDSNYRMAFEALLSKVPVPKENIFRIPAELKDP